MNTSTSSNITTNAPCVFTSNQNNWTHVVNETCFLSNESVSGSPDNDTGEYDAYIRSLKHTLNIAQSVITPLLLVLGITGNMLTIITVSHAQFHRLTSRYILCALAISDSLLLVTNPFNQLFLINALKQDLRAISNIGCKIFIIIYRTGKMSSSWFIVLVAVERFIAVHFPLKVKVLMRKATVLVLIGTVYVFMLCLTGSWSFSTKIIGELCKSDSATADNVHVHKSLVIVGATFYSLAPIAILLSLTPPIIVQLVRQHRLRQLLSANAMEQSARDVSKTTIMLTVVVINYVICVTPITLVLILSFWTNEPLFEARKPKYILLLFAAQILEQVNHSSNFIVYVMFSGQFRFRFLQIFHCRKQPKSDTLSSSSQSKKGVYSVPSSSATCRLDMQM